MVYTGRGGYGNHRSSGQAATFSNPPVQHIKSPKQNVLMGRGGFGNSVPVAKVNFESRQQYIQEIDQMQQVPTQYSTGRGGLGNFVSNKRSGSTSSSSSTQSSVKSSSSSTMSAPNAGSKLWNKLKTTISH